MEHPTLDPSPSPGGAARIARRVSSRVLPCSRCRKPLDLRFEFGAPQVLELGRREAVKLGFPCPDCGHVNERWSTDLVRFARTLGTVAAPDIVAGLTQMTHEMHSRVMERPKALEAAMLAQAGARLGKLVLELSGALTRKVEVEVREVPTEASALEAVVDELVAELAKRKKAEAVAEGVAAAAGVDLSATAPETAPGGEAAAPPAKDEGASPPPPEASP